MSTIETEDPTNGLDAAIDQILLEMKDHTSDSKEYAQMVDQLDKLYKIKAATAPDRVSLDTLVAVGGNLLGILAILNFERVNVITTKALGFVLKSKI